ncbi:putative SNARE protein (Ufe1) [Aspergillus ibericus CBS 121593]|uniref:SNARE-complex protein Syntaxin-18 N-terminal domain-containing protein n=1 Tax=Aspergillus ibericus CBS 121593 TaxID=1448316 RepID=A0A395H6B4_9EURO|nr:hypothetical protein BO80DRAFT_401476 [Aspergillus ibericus CBS 121593]RAL03452.1 hypothetical protein BO80DRAFT_401476 [Aspergillus ibericus CBS 121593]
MTDLTPTLTDLLQQSTSTPKLSTGYMTTEIADEFLKEAYRINTHITSLLQYLQTIRPSYLSLTKSKPTTKPQQQSIQAQETLTDSARDEITASTSTLLSNLSTSISTLSSAESLRQETVTRTLDQRFKRGLLAKWAGGAALTYDDDDDGEGGRSEEEVREREKERNMKCVRESVLWYLGRKLREVVDVQRDLVERRVERVREKERSVLYNLHASGAASVKGMGVGMGWEMGGVDGMDGIGTAAKMDEEEVRAIESQLTPQQLQLFEEENESMVRYFEDVVGKVQNAEKSLLEISSLQQTLVSHLATQEEYIGQLVTDASNTRGNIGEGNKELKRATERRSAAQAVFWGTVGLCTWLVVWDLAF